MSALLRSLLLVLALTATRCTSLDTPHAQHVERWHSFLRDFSKPDLVPVERVSSKFGKVVTAHASVDGGTLRVSGLLDKQAIVEVPPVRMSTSCF